MSDTAMDLNDIPIFLRVVESGSFTAAARALAMPKATVSRRVSRLEDTIGVRLIQRTTRSLSLTDEPVRDPAPNAVRGARYDRHLAVEVLHPLASPCLRASGAAFSRRPRWRATRLRQPGSRSERLARSGRTATPCPRAGHRRRRARRRDPRSRCSSTPTRRCPSPSSAC